MATTTERGTARSKKVGRPRKKTLKDKWGEDAWNLVQQEIKGGDPEELKEADFVGVLHRVEREKGCVGFWTKRNG